MDYSDDLDEVASKIRSSKADGGGDCAEDVKGALDMAYRMNHSSPTLLIYHICDAPSHGANYHNDAVDYYSD